MELIHTNLSNTTSHILFVLVLLAAIANWFQIDMFFVFTTMRQRIVLRLTYIILFICGITVLVN